MSNEIKMFESKEMSKYSEKRKRSEVMKNLSQTLAVDKFCDLMILVIKSKYTSGKKGCLTPSEKLDYLQKFCEKRKLSNKDVRRACNQKLIETHLVGVSYE